MTRPMVVLCACVTSFIVGHSLPCTPLFSNLDAAAIRRPADHDWTDLPTHRHTHTHTHIRHTRHTPDSLHLHRDSIPLHSLLLVLFQLTSLQCLP